MVEALLILAQRQGVAGVWPGIRVRIHNVEPGVGVVDSSAVHLIADLKCRAGRW